MYLLLISLTCLFWFVDYSYKVGIAKVKITRGTQLLVLFISILLIGLRDISVGTDTIAYYNRLMFFRDFELIEVLWFRNPEFGSGFLYWVGSRFQYGFRIILIIQAVFYIYSMNKVIKSYSVSYWFSLLIFFLMGFYTLSFSTMDQSTAIAFTSLAFIANEKKRKIKTIIFLIFAISFHLTAVVFVFILIFKKINVDKKLILIWGIVLVLILIFNDNLVEVIRSFGSKFERNFEIVEMGGRFFSLFYILTFALGIIWRKKLIQSNNVNKEILIAMMIVSILLPITLFHPAVPRLVYYYSIFIIIFIPNLVHSIRDLITRSLNRVAFMSVAFYLAFTQVFSLSSNIIPYRFFW